MNHDNASVINLSKNLILHSRTKHIEVRHHFIRDQVANGTASFEYLDIENQLADIFTKPLSEDKFYELRRNLGMYDPSALN